MRRRATTVAVLVLVLVGGCRAAVDEPGAAASETVSSKPEPTPAGATEEPSAEATATAEPVDPHPELADLVISTSGVGPLTVGVAPAANPGAAMIAWDDDACAGEGYDGTDPGRWVPVGYDVDTNYLGEQAPALYVDADDAGVRRIDVMGRSPRTAEGVRVGTLLTDLQGAYPGLSGPHAGPVSQVWWVQDTRARWSSRRRPAT